MNTYRAWAYSRCATQEDRDSLLAAEQAAAVASIADEEQRRARVSSAPRRGRRRASTRAPVAGDEGATLAP